MSSVLFRPQNLTYYSAFSLRAQLCINVDMPSDPTTSSQEPDLPLPEHRTRPSVADKSVINHQ
jgi:hypothetical protein